MSGTLRERPPGSGRWELRAYVGRDDKGQPRQASRTFRGGKREARRALAQFVTEVAQGKVETSTSATLGKLLDEWMNRYVERHRARATIDTYRVHVEAYIRPQLGSVRLNKLTPYVLDRYFEGLEAKGLSTGTVKLDHAIISGALTQGVDWGWIKANPAKRARIREVKKVDAPALTVDQLRDLYFAALEEDPDMAMVIALAALTGCRRGELCGLRWSDVDWARQCLKVERAWVPNLGGQHLTGTKGGKARTVFFGAEGLGLLERYWDAKRELLGHDPELDGWLLSLDGETPMSARLLTRYVASLSNRLKIPVHFHSLRHFAATELVHAGVDLPTAAGHMGHSTAVMAGVYLHSSDERGAKAGELLGSLVGKALALGE
jgi:integrase